MKLPLKPDAPGPDVPNRDRFTAWIGLRKIEGVGRGVDRAYRIAMVSTVLGFLGTVASAVAYVLTNR